MPVPKAATRKWFYLLATVAGTLLVGVSCGLPMFLYLREARLERMKGMAVDQIA